MSRACYVVNPFSGGKRGRAVCAALLELGEPNVIELDLAAIPEQFSRAAAASELVVLAGGDGTISLALPHLRNFTGRVGILPLGTANDLARELGVYRHFVLARLPEMIARLERGAARPLSLWEARGAAGSEGRLFCNYLSLGYDASVVETMDRWRRAKRGPFRRGGVLRNRAAYTAAGFRNLARPRLAGIELRAERGTPSLRVDGAMSVLFPNIGNIMGLGVSSSRADPFDGVLEAIVVQSPSLYFGMLIRRIFSTRSSAYPAAEGWDITGIPAGTPVQIDGEIRPDLQSGSLCIRRGGSINFIALD